MNTGGGDILSVKKRFRKFIVKIVRKKREQRFYNIHVKHPNIIEPEEIIRNSDQYLVILPELLSLDLALDPNSSTISKLYGMSHDLANGLQFLHDSGIAHMDIKPSNLVYHPETFVLQIIDFNSVVWMKNPDEMISGHRGTFAWMAPGLYISMLCITTLILFCSRNFAGHSIQPDSGRSICLRCRVPPDG